MTSEREFFRALNPLVEPWVQAGWLSPARWPVGVIMLETTGRRSRRSRSVPVLAMVIDEHVIIGTARGERSDWFRNLEATPELRYWLGGEAHEGRALTFAPDQEPPAVEELPAMVQHAVATLSPAVAALGCRFAVLVPEAAGS